jgi:hypothetical protein
LLKLYSVIVILVECDCGALEVLGGIPSTLPLRPPQVSHILSRERTWISSVRGRRLTACALALPRDDLEDIVVDDRVIIKWFLRSTVGWRRQSGLLADLSEHCNKSSGSIKDWRDFHYRLYRTNAITESKM